jgi:hypothetical protein
VATDVPLTASEIGFPRRHFAIEDDLLIERLARRVDAAYPTNRLTRASG